MIYAATEAWHPFESLPFAPLCYFFKGFSCSFTAAAGENFTDALEGMLISLPVRGFRPAGAYPGSTPDDQRDGILPVRIGLCSAYAISRFPWSGFLNSMAREDTGMVLRLLQGHNITIYRQGGANLAHEKQNGD